MAQDSYPDSLRKLIRRLPEDTVKLNVFEQLSGYYASSWPDSSIQFAADGLILANKLDLPLRQFYLHSNMVIAYGEKGNFSLSLEHAFRVLEIAKNMEDEYFISWSNVMIGVAYFYSEDYIKALFYAKKA
jgi:hypothetical protein